MNMSIEAIAGVIALLVFACFMYMWSGAVEQGITGLKPASRDKPDDTPSTDDPVTLEENPVVPEQPVEVQEEASPPPKEASPPSPNISNPEIVKEMLAKDGISIEINGVRIFLDKMPTDLGYTAKIKWLMKQHSAILRSDAEVILRQYEEKLFEQAKDSVAAA